MTAAWFFLGIGTIVLIGLLVGRALEDRGGKTVLEDDESDEVP